MSNKQFNYISTSIHLNSVNLYRRENNLPICKLFTNPIDLAVILSQYDISDVHNT
jgi:hypothetical protein